MNVTIRPLTESDWPGLRAIRLAALRNEPGVYTAHYEVECAYADDVWRSLAAGDERTRVFGLFDGEALVGITGVLTSEDDPSGRTAVLWMSYIEPAYRGRGLSRRFYEVRLDWIRSQGSFDRVRVSHRRSNEPSRRANQRFGFKETGSSEMAWPDGGVEDKVSYELTLVEPADP